MRLRQDNTIQVTIDGRSVSADLIEIVCQTEPLPDAIIEFVKRNYGEFAPMVDDAMYRWSEWAALAKHCR